MIFFLVFFCLLGGSTATNSTNGTTHTTGSSFNSKSIMCTLLGNLKATNAELVDLELDKIPGECEVLIYSRFELNKFSVPNVDEESLKSMVELNKPVLIVISRYRGFSEWGEILGSDGNVNETAYLCDFAIKNIVAGYIIDELTLQYVCI